MEVLSIDIYSIIFSFKPTKSLNEYLKQCKEDFNFTDFNPLHEQYSAKKFEMLEKSLETGPDLDFDKAEV